MSLEKTIYLFSGLGADERVFQKMNFLGLNIVFVKWILPLNNESIENYALRISAQITVSKPILIGLSFGGIMAIEVAKLMEVQKVILIASVKNKYEIPLYFRSVGALKLNKIIPISIFKKTSFVANWFFGIKTNAEKKLLAKIIEDTDPTFFYWAIDKIANWTNEAKHQNIVHIHGTKDRIFPIRLIAASLPIKNGGHLMTLDKPHEIMKIILREI